MLHLLAPNFLIGSFFSTNSTLQFAAHPLNARFVFITFSSSLKESSESKSMHFKRLTYGFSMYLL